LIEHLKSSRRNLEDYTLIYKGSKPEHACPFTIPRSVELQLCKETARLVEIGVLGEHYTSE